MKNIRLFETESELNLVYGNADNGYVTPWLSVIQGGGVNGNSTTVKGNYFTWVATNDEIYIAYEINHSDSNTNPPQYLTKDNPVIIKEEITNLSWMFGGYETLNQMSLISVDLSHLDASNVISTIGMFRGCKVLEEIDMSNFDMGNVQTYNDRMFCDCFSLQRIKIKGCSQDTIDKLMTAIATDLGSSYVQGDYLIIIHGTEAPSEAETEVPTEEPTE